MTAEMLLGIGREPKEYTVLQVCMRTLIIFFSALVMVRLANRRFLAQKNGFDACVALILASMLSRGINGSGGLTATIAAGFLITFLHRVLAKAAFHSHAVSKTLKGEAELVIKDGQPIEHAIASHDLTEHDLQEDLRLQGQIDEISKVREARLERSGEISIIPKEK